MDAVWSALLGVGCAVIGAVAGGVVSARLTRANRARQALDDLRAELGASNTTIAIATTNIANLERRVQELSDDLDDERKRL